LKFLKGKISSSQGNFTWKGASQLQEHVGLAIMVIVIDAMKFLLLEK